MSGRRIPLSLVLLTLGGLAVGLWPWQREANEARAGESSPVFRRYRIVNRSGRPLTNLRVVAHPRSGDPAPVPVEILVMATLPTDQGLALDRDKGAAWPAAGNDIVKVVTSWQWTFAADVVRTGTATVEIGGAIGANRIDEAVVILHPSANEAQAVAPATHDVYAWFGVGTAGSGGRFEVSGVPLVLTAR